MTTRPVTHPFWAVQTLEGGRLQCTGGPEAGARWELSGARVAIGSASDDEVRLPPGSCAEHHVVLEATDQGVSIRAAPGQSIRICGADVGEAFSDLYYLERAAMFQVLARSTGGTLRTISERVRVRARQQFASERPKVADRHFAALKRILDREEPEYRT